MVAFIDQHRDEYGVEPICEQLPISPATHYEIKAREAEPVGNIPPAEFESIHHRQLDESAAAA